MTKSRPFLVTLVCLYLLVSGSYGSIESFEYLNKPETQAEMQLAGLPVAVQVTMLYLNLVVSVVAAAFMMKDANWARWVYLGWGFVNIDYHIYLQPDWEKNLYGVGTYLVFAFVLLLPNANRYFSSKFDYEE